MFKEDGRNLTTNNKNIETNIENERDGYMVIDYWFCSDIDIKPRFPLISPLGIFETFEETMSYIENQNLYNTNKYTIIKIKLVGPLLDYGNQLESVKK